MKNHTHILHVILFMVYPFHLSSQSLELLGGINLNVFHEYASDEGHYNSSYTADIGFAGGLGYDLEIDSFRLRLTLLYETYGGGVEAEDGGLGGGYFMESNVKKSVISLGVYPLNIKINEGLYFNAGVELSVLTNEHFPGTYNWWTHGQPTITTDLEEKYSKFSNTFQYGIRLRLAYDIPVGPTITLTPQYGFYYGLSNEFMEPPERTKSVRQYLMVGLKKNL